MLGLPPLPADWHDYLGVERRLLVTELVVASCQNIEELILRMNPKWIVSVLASLPKDFVFPKLWKLFIDHYAIDYGKISGLLHASPNLRRLRLPAIEMLHPGKVELPTLQKVTYLDLGESAPPPYFLNRVLKACPNLEWFELYCSDSDESLDSTEWSPLDAWRALQHVQNSVRTIVFETDLEFRADDNLPRGVSTLRHFAHLETLVVNCIALRALYMVWARHNPHGSMEQLVYEVFPSTILHLAICDPDELSIEAVLLLAREAAREPYPHLAKITIFRSTYMKGYGFDVEQWTRQEATVRREFERSSIELRIDMDMVLDE